MKYKLIEYDPCLIENEIIFNNLKEDDINLEINYLKDNNINIVSYNIQKLQIIVENDIKLHKNLYKIIPINKFYDCDINGKLINLEKEVEKTIKKHIYEKKIEFIKKYFDENNIRIQNIKIDWGNGGLISFYCPICNKNDSKCYMFCDSFIIKTWSKTDCVDINHNNYFTKITKTLRKLWKENCIDYIKYGYYSNDLDNIINTINKLFPVVVRDEITNLIYVYDKTHYQILTEKSTLATTISLEILIRQNFKWENFDTGKVISLNNRQTSELKTKIMSEIFPKLKMVKFNSSNNLINCRNGIYNIKTKELMKHSDQYLFNYCLNIDYLQNIKTKYIDELLNDWGIDKEIFKKILAYCFIEGNPEQKFFYFKGTQQGGNGKSTVALIIKQLLNDKVLGVTLKDLYKDFYPIKIINKTTLIDDDVDTNFFLSHDIKILNKFCDGTHLLMNVKHKEAIEILADYKVLLLANQSIKFKNNEEKGGFWRRYYIIKFEHNLTKEKPSVRLKIQNDSNIKSQILNYLIEGLEMWINKNVDEKWFNKQENEILEEQKASNPTIEYILNTYKKSNNHKDRIFFQNIFDDYIQYCRNERLNEVSPKNFRELFIELFSLKTKQIRINNETKKGYEYIMCNNLEIKEFDNEVIDITKI